MLGGDDATIESRATTENIDAMLTIDPAPEESMCRSSARML
jgi:hypothetical protein